MPKKDFTKGDSAIDKFFNKNEAKHTQHTDDTQVNNNDKYTYGLNNTNDSDDTNYTNNLDDDNIANDLNNYNNTNVGYTANVTNKARNKSKHYDERGPRDLRFGLLLDSQLKNDLVHLSKVLGSKSVNDLINTVLLEYVDRSDNQAKLEQFKKLLN